MKAVFCNHTVAHGSQGSYPAEAPQLSPEHSDASSSGAYFRAVRPTPAEVAVSSELPDSARLDRLRFALEADLWHANSELIAARMLDDAG